MMTSMAGRPTQDGMAVVQDPRWARLVARDKGADGLFWYSVATTGIYCRPSCPSRQANPRNVGFGVSKIRSGRRHTVGIIFHVAA